MKRLILLCVFFALTGCATSVPVKMNFPQAPESLKEACVDLQQLDPNTKKLSEVVAVVSKNYGQYQECQVKVNSWIDWYNTQKKIFEDIK
jgi:hypothetical protein